MRSRPGAPRDGEEASSAACSRSRVCLRPRALAGVAPPRRSASPSLAPSPSPEPPTQNPRCDPRVTRFTPVQSARQTEHPSSIGLCAGKPPPLAAARHRPGRRRLSHSRPIASQRFRSNLSPRLTAAVRSRSNGSDPILPVNRTAPRRFCLRALRSRSSFFRFRA